jgi:CRISPR type III-A-associated RAMP protein Csm4
MKFLVRLRPTGPWRIGATGGTRDLVDFIYHSDALYSAVTGAMKYFGLLDEWLAATASNPAGSAVRFSSCFPFIGKNDLIVPPRTIWPPAPSPKIRWKGARFVPVSVVQSLLSGEALNDDSWSIDGPSECLVPSGKSGPFRVTVRSAAAVDRLTGNTAPHSTACIEFTHGAGLWCIVDTEARWEEPVKAAFRWLADSGFGGKRSSGWGRSATPEFSELTGLLANGGESSSYWLLSLFAPDPSDEVNWDRGNYSVITRGGWVDSPAANGEAKKMVRVVEEGSVLSASKALVGSAADVAPDGFPHPVYRSGFAYAISLPAVAA